ncbi:PqqD family protein [Angustibacter sp. Root456]|uniref:PqqD family protein n=1 Tax=Angustibacter sp. Root456 TaxID=1736539 RepID=UPI0006F70EF4|nr:PqqD family protein [Angustibacter sp. Root456]KQX69345.1 hypothetical protein ASD06_16535 [Angustibacter sp. Root456]
MSHPDAVVGPPLAGVTEVELDGRVCLYAPSSEQVVMLNDTASDVWRLVDGTLSEQRIVELLAAAYAVGAEQIRPDVVSALATFRAEGLLADASDAG